MRCQRCHFENVPGESRCFKCGSVLSGQGITVDVHPPRMGKLAGPLRAAFRWFRFRKVLPEATIGPRVPAFLRIMSGDAFLGIILSIIPGLAQYAEGRFREIRWYVLAWFFLLLAGIFLYGSSIGWLLLGLAIGLHGWIALSHMLSEEQVEPSKKVRTFVMVLIVFSFFYWGIRMVAFRDFVVGYANSGIPYQNVQLGDCLLARRSRAGEDVLPRGSLVFGRFRELRVNQRGLDRRFNTIGQIVALPGDTIEIKERKFVVNGRILDEDKFPVPGWLSGRQLSATIIPSDSYFVSTVYRVTGANMPGNMIRDACILPKGDIEALAVMRWFPLTRRGFLRSYE